MCAFPWLNLHLMVVQVKIADQKNQCFIQFCFLARVHFPLWGSSDAFVWLVSQITLCKRFFFLLLLNQSECGKKYQSFTFISSSNTHQMRLERIPCFDRNFINFFLSLFGIFPNTGYAAMNRICIKYRIGTDIFWYSNHVIGMLLCCFSCL